MSELLDSLNKLNDALEASHNDFTQGPIIDVVDRLDLAKPFVTESTLLALSKKATSQVIQTPGTMDGYICIYLAVLVKTSNLLKGIETISKSLNALTEKELIHSTLVKLSSIELVKVFGQAPSSAVFSFVLVPISRKKESEDLALYAMEDGHLGNAIEDLSVELGEGEFLSNVRINIFHHSSVNTENVVDERIKELLNILPKGTELVSITPCHISGLCADYEVKFRNPLMNNYKEVRLEHMREVVKISDKIEQFNLLYGIKYIIKG